MIIVNLWAIAKVAGAIFVTVMTMIGIGFTLTLFEWK